MLPQSTSSSLLSMQQMSNRYSHLRSWRTQVCAGRSRGPAGRLPDAIQRTHFCVRGIGSDADYLPRSQSEIVPIPELLAGRILDVPVPCRGGRPRIASLQVSSCRPPGHRPCLSSCGLAGMAALWLEDPRSASKRRGQASELICWWFRIAFRARSDWPGWHLRLMVKMFCIALLYWRSSA